MDKLVSFVVPVYNIESYIEKCVDSIISQTYKNVEVLLVDDGSTDKSGIICDTYAEKDSRVKAFHKPNGGLSSARNFGLEKASGDYVFLVDGDDYVADTICEKFLEKAEAFDADVVVGAEEFLKYDNYVETVEKEVADHFDFNKVYSGKEYLLHSFKYCHLRIEVHRSMYKLSFLKENGLSFMNKVYYEDEEFTPRVFLRAERVALVKERLYYYDNTRGGSIMHDTSKKKLRGRSYDKIARILLNEYSTVPEKELRRYLEDDISWKYLDSYAVNDMISDSEYKPLKKEILKAAKTPNRKIKALIFCISEKLFLKIFGHKG